MIPNNLRCSCLCGPHLNRCVKPKYHMGPNDDCRCFFVECVEMRRKEREDMMGHRKDVKHEKPLGSVQRRRTENKEGVTNGRQRMRDADTKPINVERLRTKPVRKCLTRHHCLICNKNIVWGELYYDGGYPRRAHVACMEGHMGSAWKERNDEL